jgi:hypothetical protein
MSATQTKLSHMQTNPTWANLGVVCFEKGMGYSIETISVDTNSCTLSGAWDFETLEDPALTNILGARLVITCGLENGEVIANQFNSTRVDIKSFITDASNSAKDGVERFNRYLEENARQYSDYMSIPPAERKLLPKVIKKKLEPIYAHSWDLTYDEFAPELTLRQLGKRESIEGTPRNMVRLITTSWLIKHLVDRWREDEMERKSRDYLYPEGEEIDVLPQNWMTELSKLDAAS